MPEDVFLGLGSNSGDRPNNLAEAVKKIRSVEMEVLSVSPVYETEPWGFRSESKFLNMVVKISTGITPEELLVKISGIERELGRIRKLEHYSDRPIDIDILLYGDLILKKKDLVIPHPLIEERRFVLVPLCDLLPEGVHPLLNKTYSELLKDCRDKGDVKFYSTLKG